MDAPIASLLELLGPENVIASDAASDDYTHDEALSAVKRKPLAVVRPTQLDHVRRVLRWASDHGVPVTPRGAGTGLSGACIPKPNGVILCFERMAQILEIDPENHAAVVEAGVSLEALNAAAAEQGLVYPVFPGENSASLGGNVATNAGGMRAVKYGVTRHHVLGLEFVLPDGSVLRSGGKFVKSSTGYDLTQLIVGSEGTLALVTEITVRLHHRPRYNVTVVAPFASLEQVTSAVTPITGSGIGPVVLEYIDAITMGAITSAAGIDLGVPAQMKEQALAYLVVVLENDHENRLDEDTG